MKTLLIIANYANTYSGSFINSMNSFYNRYKNDFNFIFIFPKSENNDYLTWMNDFKKNKNIQFIEFDDSTMFKNIDLINPDICWCHFLSIYSVLNFANRLKKINFIFHAHGQLNFTKIQLLKLFIKNKRKDNNIKVICASKPLRRFFIPFVKRKYIKVARNAVDFSRFQDNSISFDKVGIAMFGYDCQVKGVDIACLAIKHIKDKYNVDIPLDIYCSKNINQAKSLVSKFSNYNINVIYTSGNPDNIYKKHKIFISPSRKEAFCYSIVESIYCGTPVIYSNLKEQNHNDLYSYSFKTKNYKSLANVIMKVMNNYDSLIKDINNDSFKNNLIEKYSMDIWSQQTYDIILGN